MRNINWYLIIGFAIIVLILFQLTACSTVAGMGKDITGAAEWTKEKVTQPRQEPAK
jgi:predicted small secreted protein